MPSITAPLEGICATCAHYGWKPDPEGWNWAYCFKKEKWFPESIQEPGNQKGCKEWSHPLKSEA